MGNVEWVNSNTSHIAHNTLLIFIEEFLFLVVLIFWSYIRAHQPAIEGLEKFMDYGFVKSILNSTYFPPQDMWLARSASHPELAEGSAPEMLRGFYINYYYFGHLVLAVLTKLSTLPSEITYNLQIATLPALTFAGSFSLGINLFHSSSNQEKNIEGDNFFEESVVRASPPPKSWLRGIGRSVNNYWTRYIGGRKGELTSEKKFVPKKFFSRKLIFAGLLTAYLVTFSGNLHTIYSFTPGYSVKGAQTPPPPWELPLDTNLSDYWYPNATRFIPYTIHEFPSYSAIVADLHGHFSNIPFVLLMLAVLFALIKNSKSQTSNYKQIPNHKHQITNKPGLFEILKIRIWNLFGIWNLEFGYLLLIGFLLAVFYMTNSWDTLVYSLLTLTVLVIASISNNISHQATHVRRLMRNFTISFLLIGVAFFVFSYPFTRSFDPFSSKIGVNCGYKAVTTLNSLNKLKLYKGASLGSQQAIEFGPFIFEPNKCQHTLPWMHLILWGFFYYIIAGFIIFVLGSGKSKILTSHFSLPQISHTHIFLILMIVVSLFLLWVPEFFYIKDIYPAHFRANTMFKLGYQAFIMLSLVSGYSIIKIFSLLKISHKPSYVRCLMRKIYILILIPLLLLVSIYPLFGINSYYNGLTSYKGLYGLNWLRDRYPDDYKAIVWLDRQAEQLCGNGQWVMGNVQDNSHNTSHITHRCPTILEAVGDSYTQCARVSANTGLPTVIGWPVHEWLWRGSYEPANKRRTEVKTIYTSKDTQQVKQLLGKYDVKYIFVGNLEREKYPKLSEQVFNDLGEVVYQSGNTRIYKITDL
jgi:YYY domain-containing protein